MWIGWLEAGPAPGRRPLPEGEALGRRPIVAELQRRFAVSAAEVGAHDLHRRATVGAALVAADRSHVVEVLDAIERLVAGRPEADLLSARRGLRTSDD